MAFKQTDNETAYSSLSEGLLSFIISSLPSKFK